jgi:hypothetical protein
MTTATNDNPSGIPLDYGQQPSRWKRAWTRISAWFHEHFEDWLKAIGYSLATLIYLAGGYRQAILALGVAFLAGGLGLAIEAGRGGSGDFWMWVGGFMVGLIIPLSKTGSGK